jgi:hypothetical protein
MIQEFLINTITSWDEPPRARHQFTRALSKKMPVIFISRNETGWLKLKIRHPEKNITVIEPHFPIDYRIRYRVPMINEIYQWWLYSRLKKKFRDPYIINFDFTARLLPRYFKNNVYYCNDEYTSTSRINIRPINWYITQCEKYTATHSRFCVATSDYLVEKLSRYNPNSFEIPLGVDIMFAHAGIVSDGDDKSGPIRVGLLGYISERQISIDLINQIINDDRFELVIIGPIENSFLRKMVNLERVKMTGMLTGPRLITELSRIDVGIALYNLKHVNKGATANKLWQYISLGKPVVVSYLPNLKKTAFPGHSVYIIYDEKNALNEIVLAAKEDNDELRKARVEFASQNTWEVRVEKFFQIFKSQFLME